MKKTKREIISFTIAVVRSRSYFLTSLLYQVVLVMQPRRCAVNLTEP